MEDLLALDKETFLFLNGISGPWLDFIFGWPTFLGEKWLAIPLVLISLWVWDRKDAARKSGVFFASVVMVSGAVQLLKWIVARPRPYDVFLPDVTSGLLHIRYLFEQPDSYSFPSGHAALSFSIAVVLNHLYAGRLKFLYFLAVIVSFSRVYNGAHFPFDVVGGILVGILGSMFCLCLVKKYTPYLLPPKIQNSNR